MQGRTLNNFSMVYPFGLSIISFAVTSLCRPIIFGLVGGIRYIFDVNSSNKTDYVDHLKQSNTD